MFDFILVSASFLGWPFALFKVLSAAVTGIVGGLLVDRFHANVPRESHPATAQRSSTHSTPAIGRIVRHGLDIIRSIWLWLVVGILASAAIEVFVPESFLAGIGSLGILPSALAVLAVSLPLYVCATASVPIAAALVAGGLPPGTALVFLMAGPATNVATMGAIYRRFGGRVLAVYLATITVGSGIAALAFDWLVSETSAIELTSHSMHHAWWAQVCAILLLGLFGWFLADGLSRWFRQRSVPRDQSLREVRVAVHGMRCGNCVTQLEGALRNTTGIQRAIVKLEPGEAIVWGSVGKNEVGEVIREAGFRTE